MLQSYFVQHYLLIVFIAITQDEFKEYILVITWIYKLFVLSNIHKYVYGKWQ